MWCLLLRIAAGFFADALVGPTSDFKAAYRQITAAPGQARPFVVAMWAPVKGFVAYGIAVGQLFGSGSAPLDFSRFPAWCVYASGMSFGVLVDHCVDDILFVEQLLTGMSAFTSWRRFAVCCGWDIQDKKSPPPSQRFRTLGAITNLSAFPTGPILLEPAADRVAKILDELQDIFRNQR